MWIDGQFIKEAHPVYAVKEGDQFWRCTFDYDGAQLISYLLVDIHGNEYSCSRAELEKLGIHDADEKQPIGFIMNPDDSKTRIALDEEDDD